MDNSVLLVLGMLLSLSQGEMDIPNCNLTNSIGHLQGTCCLDECDHTSEETICEYECPKDMFLSQDILWDKNGGSLCRHGCRQTCPDNYYGARINDMCVECFILCRLEIRHTSCKCQNEKIENEESSLETKDYIIIALAITSFVLLVVLVMVVCYWKRKWNKYNTKTIENIEMHLKDKVIIIKDDGNIQETNNEAELVNEETRYVEDPTKSKTKNKIESDTYAYVATNMQSFGSTPDPSVGKGENMAELGVYTEVCTGEINTSSTSNGRLASTSSTQEDLYENTTTCITNNPDDDDLYQYVSGSKSNSSTTIPSDNGENGNHVGTYSDTVIKSYEIDVESSANSSEGGAETSVTPNTAHGEKKIICNNFNIKTKKLTLKMANK